MNEPTTRHWADDPYWTEAFEASVRRRQRQEYRGVRRRRITLDLDAIERALFEADGPAYRLMEAMASVKEHEGWEGYRGAPRLVLALLERLDEISKVGAEKAG
jgi:hypothetical protein